MNRRQEMYIEREAARVAVSHRIKEHHLNWSLFREKATKERVSDEHCVQELLIQETSVQQHAFQQYC